MLLQWSNCFSLYGSFSLYLAHHRSISCISLVQVLPGAILIGSASYYLHPYWVELFPRSALHQSVTCQWVDRLGLGQMLRLSQSVAILKHHVTSAFLSREQWAHSYS